MKVDTYLYVFKPIFQALLSLNCGISTNLILLQKPFICFQFYFLLLAFKEVDRSTPLDLASVHADCIEMFAFFNMKLVDALIKATKISFEKIKQRATR